jgi:hypothetical protein
METKAPTPAVTAEDGRRLLARAQQAWHDSDLQALVDALDPHTVESYGQWLSTSPIPKLFVDAEPAGFLIGAQREFCRSWPNQQTVTVAGSHFLQADAPDAVGQALARFVAQVAAAQIASAPA